MAPDPASWRNRWDPRVQPEGVPPLVPADTRTKPTIQRYRVHLGVHLTGELYAEMVPAARGNWAKWIDVEAASLGVVPPPPAAPSFPFKAWHEDDHDVLWWQFPIQEAPYIGSPLSSDWPFSEQDASALAWTRLVIPDPPSPPPPAGKEPSK
jgi:hypothetical protein